MDCNDKQHGCCHKKSSSLRRNLDCFDVVEIAFESSNGCILFSLNP